MPLMKYKTNLRALGILAYAALPQHCDLTMSLNTRSSIGAGLASFQDGRSKMAAMAPIQDGVQTQLRFMTSDDPLTRSVSPRRVS